MDLLPENRQSCHDDAGEEGNDDDIAVSVIWRVSHDVERTCEEERLFLAIQYPLSYSLFVSRVIFPSADLGRVGLRIQNIAHIISNFSVSPLPPPCPGVGVVRVGVQVVVIIVIVVVIVIIIVVVVIHS